MNAKRGLAYGLIAGFLCWWISSGNLIFIPAPMLAQDVAIVLAAGLFIISVGLTIVDMVRRKAYFSPAKDAFIFGFTTAFDILYIVTQFLLGKLPLP